jgi:uncharacterized protein
MALLRRYLSGLAVATFGLCAAGWLALAPTAFGYRGDGLHRAALTDRATAAGLGVACLVTMVCSILAWRRRLRADGVLRPRVRRAARRRTPAPSTDPAPDPARVLSELRVLLASVMPPPASGAADGRDPVTIPAPRGEPMPEVAAVPEAAPEPEVVAGLEVTAEPALMPAAESGAEPGAEFAAGPEPGPVPAAVPEPRQGSLAAMESMLAGAGLLMVGCGEEEAW